MKLSDLRDDNFECDINYRFSKTRGLQVKGKELLLAIAPYLPPNKKLKKGLKN